MASPQQAGQGDTSTRSYGHGAIVRELGHLCRQVDALTVPLPAPNLPANTSTSIQRPGDANKGQHQIHQAKMKALLSLPKLVLVGGQSVGKSSLVECLTGVSLPRSDGTCTRGPLDIDITPTDVDSERSFDNQPSWTAVISVVLPASSSAASASIIQFGDTIDDPSFVADRIRRASIAILDNYKTPSRKPKPTDIIAAKYFNMTVEELADAEDTTKTDFPLFFPEGVRLSLSIQAPGAEPLCFTDLPGLITFGNPTELQATREVIKREIQHDNTIIIYVANLDSDLRSQGAFLLVRAADPTGKRTVGVLTKPDRMAGGDRQWVNLINESSPLGVQEKRGRHYLRHGWHVVRCLGTDEELSNITQIESDFFHGEQGIGGVSGWQRTASMLNPVDAHGTFVQTRCGLGNLSRSLSRLLLNKIRETLPSTIASITELTERLNLESLSVINAVDDSVIPSRVPASRAIQWSSTNEFVGQGLAVGFFTQRELIKCVDKIIGYFQMTSFQINNDLVPRLLDELLAIAPVYLPFTAAEASDPQIVAAYRPQPWMFHAKLFHKIGQGAVHSGHAEDDHDDDIRNDGSTASSSDSSKIHHSAMKHRVTLDDLVKQLQSEPSFSTEVSLTHHFGKIHEQLQQLFLSTVHTCAKYVRKHLSSLIKNAVPQEAQATYAQLVADLVEIADHFVQDRLTREMRMLAGRVEQYSPLEHSAGRAAGSRSISTQGEDENDYSDWVAREQEAYLMLRVNLVAKQRADAGDKNFLANVNKAIEALYKANFFEKGHGTDLHFAQPIPGGLTPAPTQTSPKTPNRKGRKSADPAPEPTPELEDDSESRSSHAPSASRQRVSTPLFDGVLEPPLSASPGAYSTPALAVYPRLALVADLLTSKDPWMFTTIKLMSHLRGDFNYFSLLVAEGVQEVPVRLMQDLYTYLRDTVSRDFAAHLSDDEVYQRYFTEADRPRREMDEWKRKHKQRSVLALNVLEQLKSLLQRLKGGNDGGETMIETARGTEDQGPLGPVGEHSTPTTPVRQRVATINTKASPVTPRQTGQLEASVTPSKKRPSPNKAPTTPSKIRNTTSNTTGFSRGKASVIGLPPIKATATTGPSNSVVRAPATSATNNIVRTPSTDSNDSIGVLVAEQPRATQHKTFPVSVDTAEYSIPLSPVYSELAEADEDEEEGAERVEGQCPSWLDPHIESQVVIPISSDTVEPHVIQVSSDTEGDQ